MMHNPTAAVARPSAQPGAAQTLQHIGKVHPPSPVIARRRTDTPAISILPGDGLEQGASSCTRGRLLAYVGPHDDGCDRVARCGTWELALI
jgi:hypothetical protein